MDEQTYRLTAHARVTAHGIPLLVALRGFADAGSVVELITNELTNNLDSEVVARFDNDLLLDYRSRRPTVFFDADHVSTYEMPELTLREVHDGTGQPFLLLSGYEPDFRWEQVMEDVLTLAEHFEVSSITWVQSIPTPVPHTRPSVSIISGNVQRNIDMFSVWKPKTAVPGSLAQLLEKEFLEAGYEVTGIIMLAPHYLAENEYPPTAVAALERITLITGLVLPTDDLRDEGKEFLKKLSEQVLANPELQVMVKNLEQRHDRYLKDIHTEDDLGEAPDGDELAKEFETFLAKYHNDSDDNRGL
ncbi:MAG: PAC2 family protein [Microbacteriaceae bacterium]|jgi:hypothetical protein|nr:PAC2 family protein [Microbacteriaceae bacterium]MCI1207691.1 PAC2 family protein [Microbacteriaceae bacterium]